jgi:hypothetical protein
MAEVEEEQFAADDPYGHKSPTRFRLPAFAWPDSPRFAFTNQYWAFFRFGSRASMTGLRIDGEPYEEYLTAEQATLLEFHAMRFIAEYALGMESDSTYAWAKEKSGLVE